MMVTEARYEFVTLSARRPTSPENAMRQCESEIFDKKLEAVVDTKHV